MEGFTFNEQVDEDKLKNLLELGIDEEKARYAMMLCDNDIESAAGMAMEMDIDQLKEECEYAMQGEGEQSSQVEQKDVNQLMEMFSLSLQSKMVILVRTDLGMSVGKVAAQVGHAVLGCYKTASMQKPTNVDQWEMNSWPKIVLGVESEQQMEEMK